MVAPESLGVQAPKKCDSSAVPAVTPEVDCDEAIVVVRFAWGLYNFKSTALVVL